MKILLVLVMCAVLVACSKSSGVLKMGTDTYTISTRSKSVPQSRKHVYIRANRFCEKLKKEMVVTDEDYANRTTSLTFLCLYPSDERLKNPSARTGVDTVIETRGR